MSSNRIEKQDGFTLVELLVVIAIIGILAVAVTPALFRNINKARVADFESDYQAVKAATVSYFADKDKVPTRLEDLVSEGYIEGLSGKSPLGGEYKLRGKNEKNEISTPYGRIKAYKTNSDATISKDYVEIDLYGDVFFSLQGMQNNVLYLTHKQFEKLVEDIGYENVFISSDNMASSYQTGEVYIRVTDNILPKPIK